ncbi:MAG: PIG-L family deacetylase [Bacteroidaceae bacterium]|nr:PIG-L family deacetylase [Bacteroidaceae bacterium]
MNRRSMLKASGNAAAITILGGIPLSTAAETPDGVTQKRDKKKIMIIGAHPDDPETSSGGTICLLTDAGHEVVCVYLTKGQAGIRGKSHDEAAAIREQEAIAACAVMNARPLFLTQVDGNTEVNRDRFREMQEMLEREKPDVVITHWPIDGHRDHANCGILVLAAWKQLKRCFDLYYFEVMSGWQTQMFHPTDFVDITTTRERKYQACYCHESQHLTKVMEGWHTPMEQFRGIECRCTAAEAFAHHIEPLKMD